MQKLFQASTTRMTKNFSQISLPDEKSLLDCQKKTARVIGLYVNSNKTENISYKKKEPSSLRVVSH